MAGLIGSGQAYKQQAISGISTAAALESGREQRNDLAKAQAKSENMGEMGGAIGTGAGIGLMVGGPIGAGIGAIGGLLASQLF